MESMGKQKNELINESMNHLNWHIFDLETLISDNCLEIN